MKNELLPEIKSSEDLEAMGAAEQSPQVAVFLRVLGRKLEATQKFLTQPRTCDDDWRKDVRWLMAQEALLKDLIGLPQAVRDKLRGEGDGK